MVSPQRMGVETAVDCVFEAVDPYREVLLFIIRRESVDFDLLAVLDLRTASVVGVCVAVVFCREVAVTVVVSPPFSSSSYGAAARVGGASV